MDLSLQGIAFVDRQTGWAVGGSQFGFGTALLHTTDGGGTWTSQLENVSGLRTGPGVATGFGFFAVAFTTARHGVAVGAAEQGGAIYGPPALIVVTDDAGAHWRARIVSSLRHGGILRSVCLTDNGAGIVVGYAISGGIVVTTSDGGATWTDISDNANLAGGDTTLITSAACAQPDQFWISGVNIGGNPVGARSDLLYSADGGKTWTNRTPSIANVSGSTFQLLPLSFADAVDGWTIPAPPSGAAGMSPFVLHTTDAGEHWAEQAVPEGFGGTVNALAVDDQRGVAVGATPEDSTQSRSAAAIATDDAGGTWHEASFPPGIGRLLAVTIVP